MFYVSIAWKHPDKIKGRYLEKCKFSDDRPRIYIKKE